MERETEYKAAEEAALYLSESPAKLAKKITELEKQMYTHARNLEFEEAAKVRDQINQLQTLLDKL